MQRIFRIARQEFLPLKTQSSGYKLSCYNLIKYILSCQNTKNTCLYRQLQSAFSAKSPFFSTLMRMLMTREVGCGIKKWIIIIYALGFGTWKVRRLHWSRSIVEPTDWTCRTYFLGRPKLHLSNLIDSNVAPHMYFIRGMRFDTWKVRRLNRALLRKSVQRGLTLISLGKCGSPPIKVTLTELSTSNLRLAFTLN